MGLEVFESKIFILRMVATNKTFEYEGIKINHKGKNYALFNFAAIV